MKDWNKVENPAQTTGAAGRRSENLQFALFIAGSFAGLAQFSTPVGFGTGFEMVAIGRNLAATGAFANPFAVLATGPTADNPPAYPIFLALLHLVFRTPAIVLLVAMIANILANACVAAWLPRLSELFFQDAKPGIVASLLWIGSARLMPSWDASFTTAALILFCLTSGASLGKSIGDRSALLAGLLAGLLFLLNPASLLVTIPWVFYLLLERKRTWRQSAILVAVLLAAISLWVGRNCIRLGAPVVRTNLGATLYASNNDCAQSSLIANESHNCFQSHHPNVSLPEAQLLLALGEVAYDRKRKADAIAWIEAHPNRFRELTIARIRDFWFPPALDTPFQIHAIWLSTILSFPGLVWMARRREKICVFVFPVLLLYPLMYYVAASDVRYRYPVLWLSSLSAGYPTLAIPFSSWLSRDGKSPLGRQS